MRQHVVAGVPHMGGTGLEQQDVIVGDQIAPQSQIHGEHPRRQRIGVGVEPHDVKLVKQVIVAQVEIRGRIVRQRYGCGLHEDLRQA